MSLFSPSSCKSAHTVTTLDDILPRSAEPVSAELTASMIEFALSLTVLIDQHSLAPFRQTLCSEDKPSRRYFDPVTQADKDTEAALRAAIKARFPQHGIIGEEWGNEPTQDGLTWVLDPIDGTRSFISGVPMWTSLLGLYAGQQPVFGMAYQPYTQELFYGTPQASFLRRGPDALPVPITVSRCARLSEAKLVTTDPEVFEPHERVRFEAVRAESLMSRYGTDAYGYCLLAAGQVDVVVESGLAVYDYLPLLPILQGAGACVSDWQGRAPNQCSQALVVSATADLQQAVLSRLDLIQTPEIVS